MPQSNWLALFTLSLGVFIAFSQVPKWNVFIFYIMGIALMMLFEIIFELLERTCFSGFHIQLLTDFKIVFIIRIVLEPFLILIWYLNSKIYNRLFHVDENKEFDQYIPFILVEAFSLYLIYLNIITTEQYKRFYAEVLLLIVIAAFLLFDFMLIHAFKKIDTLHKKEIQERTFREIMQIQMKNYKFQHQKTLEFRKIRHDLVNQLQTIQLFLENNKVDKAIDILKTYSKEVQFSSIKNFTGNEFADMVINKKLERIQKEGISFVSSGTIPHNLQINPAAFCSLIENILDNAINGCVNSKRPSKTIDFRVAADKNKLMLKCTNTCSDDSIKPVKVKRENGDHGWGTQIIESIATHYGGNTIFQVENGVFITTVYCFLDQDSEEIAYDR